MTHPDFLARIRAAEPADPVPTSEELTEHLRDRRARVGATAFAEFAYLQQVAAERWGAAATSHFGRVLRAARVRPKTPRRTAWEAALGAAAALPTPWRSRMERQIERSRAPKRVPGFTSWSADYAQAVSTALRRWTEYAATAGLPPVPNGLMLDRYGALLTDGTEQKKPVSLRTAADYLSRIHAGLAIVEPDSVSTARAYVVRDWRERADLVGAPTKTGSQMVGASSIYDLGFQLMDEARSRAMRGLDAAKTYRNGLILSVGIALPQRARALSALAFESSLRLTGGDAIHVRIPAAMLKQREDRKGGEPFDTVFHNDLLADALREYRHDFRPVFDDAPALFPSVLGRGHALSERRIGALAGNMTKAAFGVRISIHRLRDNVATEASEELDAGARAATVLLGHRDQAITARHYDQSEGTKATREYTDFIDARRTAPAQLML